MNTRCNILQQYRQQKHFIKYQVPGINSTYEYVLLSSKREGFSCFRAFGSRKFASRNLLRAILLRAILPPRSRPFKEEHCANGWGLWGVLQTSTYDVQCSISRCQVERMIRDPSILCVNTYFNPYNRMVYVRTYGTPVPVKSERRYQSSCPSRYRHRHDG